MLEASNTCEALPEQALGICQDVGEKHCGALGQGQERVAVRFLASLALFITPKSEESMRR